MQLDAARCSQSRVSCARGHFRPNLWPATDRCRTGTNAYRYTPAPYPRLWNTGRNIASRCKTAAHIMRCPESSPATHGRNRPHGAQGGSSTARIQLTVRRQGCRDTPRPIRFPGQGNPPAPRRRGQTYSQGRQSGTAQVAIRPRLVRATAPLAPPGCLPRQPTARPSGPAQREAGIKSYFPAPRRPSRAVTPWPPARGRRSRCCGAVRAESLNKTRLNKPVSIMANGLRARPFPSTAPGTGETGSFRAFLREAGLFSLS